MRKLSLPVMIEPKPSSISGYVLYEGPSILDGKHIVMIATGFKGSHNAKTGHMIQTWILRSDNDPIKSIYAGCDASICGTCKHRTNSPFNPQGWSTCYVNVTQAPLAVYRSYKSGKYPKIQEADWERFRDLPIRLGSYGDPAAVPMEVLTRLVGLSSRHTGYTHQWAYGDQRLRNIVMASVDTPEEYRAAKAMGWRTFRCRMPDEPLAPGERICPASEEGGKKTNCAHCSACKGGNPKLADIAIIVHGSTWKPKRFKKIRDLMKAGESFLGLVRILKSTIDKRGTPRNFKRKPGACGGVK